ncbi:MAG: ABC transporter permease subunit [Gemmataceae bacterium]|nr:ABC transporter permease subunit [Gemmataceae bacterium]
MVAAVAACLIHVFIPNGQNLEPTWMDPISVWQQPYPIVLQGLFLVSLFLALLHWQCLPARPWVRYYAPLLAGAMFLFGVDDLLSQKLAWLPWPFFPGPGMVLGCSIEDCGIIFSSTWHSLLLLVSGYVVGVCMGVLTGVLIGWFPSIRYWGMPLLKVIGPLPATAMVPAVMMLSNDSFIPATALIGFAVWFPVTMLTSSGMSNVRLSYLDVARTLGAGEWYLIFRVAIPSALPTIFIGLFMGLGVSFLTLIGAEAVGVPGGLGNYIKAQQSSMEYTKMYGAWLVTAVLFSGLITCLFRTRDWVLNWQKGVIKW